MDFSLFRVSWFLFWIMFIGLSSVLSMLPEEFLWSIFSITILSPLPDNPVIDLQPMVKITLSIVVKTASLTLFLRAATTLSTSSPTLSALILSMTWRYNVLILSKFALWKLSVVPSFWSPTVSSSVTPNWVLFPIAKLFTDSLKWLKKLLFWCSLLIVET